ncbi:MAG: DUF739 family protein [Tissierellia bacterium]|nr:DUF739 family protein [Tissierellia bacterium]
MSFNYSKLKGKIIENYGTQAAFARGMNMSERTLSLKLNNKIYFRQDEIIKAASLLNIRAEEIREYFFIIKVQSD